MPQNEDSQAPPEDLEHARRLARAMAKTVGPDPAMFYPYHDYPSFDDADEAYQLVNFGLWGDDYFLNPEFRSRIRGRWAFECARAELLQQDSLVMRRHLGKLQVQGSDDLESLRADLHQLALEIGAEAPS